MAKKPLEEQTREEMLAASKEAARRFAEARWQRADPEVHEMERAMDAYYRTLPAPEEPELIARSRAWLREHLGTTRDTDD